MRTHLHDGEFLSRLRSFPGLGYLEFPFPVSSLFLFGDDEYLRFAYFGCHLTDTRDLDTVFEREMTASLRAAAGFLESYLSGKEAALPALDLSVYTGKEQLIYDRLLGVGFGETVSYADLARGAGMPRAARFAGSCMAKNIFPVFIPCHRVIKTGGEMGNYSGGIEIKRFLLKHEESRG